MHVAADDVGGPKVRQEVDFMGCGDVFVDAAKVLRDVAEGKSMAAKHTDGQKVW